jgi:hypothetical protein
MDDPEINAMSAVATALKDLEEESQGRVLRWAADRYGVYAPSAGVQGSMVADKDTISTGEVTEEQITEKAPQYEYFADFFAAASPKSNEDKALIAAYWVQVYEGHDTWASRLLNSELKDLGHSIPNITDALSSNMRKKPQRVVQLKKSGNTRQANKTYKVTHEGLVYVQGMLHGESAS